ncbi:YezD family protein [Luteolibacter yonseiensis]|uniref:YezD family protein n=1 Tax=Luteolibacter yonseiensis TaxID=1144680 RepID=A0A934R1X7_9BACT|nr:YezD family protein [Luteolibacter yonseiensis]MBK1814035.1 YezD family protein [Luteolibacter yonseiensis]
MSTITTEQPSTEAPKHDWLEIVRKNAANLRFGSVQITVHDGRVTQVESIEKTRFVSPREEAPKLKTAS